MSRLIESIRIENRKARDLDYHQKRMDKSYKMLFGQKCPFRLEEMISCSFDLNYDKVKCRVIYDHSVFKIEFSSYQIKHINSFKLLHWHKGDYEHKFEDRSSIEELLKQKGNADDIIIVKDGLITDSSYANLVFKKDRRLYTPKSCLLPGTKREKYLARGIVRETEIHPKNLHTFSHVKRINAMMNLEDSPWLPIESILNLNH